MIDNLIQISSKKTEDRNFIYDDPEFRQQLEKNVEKLELFLNYNSNLETAFIRLNKKIHGIEELNNIKSQFEGVYQVVSLSGRGVT